MSISIDDAIAVIVFWLKDMVSPLSPNPSQPNARQARSGCDMQIKEVFDGWWHKENLNKNPLPEAGELDYAPFYDAAWELARRGILRPGPVVPVLGIHSVQEVKGFSLTIMGHEWIKRYDQQQPFPIDQARFAVLIDSYSSLFGLGFIQRASEAAGCYRTLNYLACCAMVGAACEAILLSIAIKKTSDEKLVQKTYLGRDGRRELINKLITPGLPEFLKQAIETTSNLLSYWRDSASHGYAVRIEEFEAHDAMSRLLRFAQLIDQHWDKFMLSKAA